MACGSAHQYTVHQTKGITATITNAPATQQQRIAS
jgi:hypothetical protein